MYFCQKIRFPVPKIVLNVKKVGQFHFFIVFIQIRSGINKEYSHFGLFLAPGFEFVNKIHRKWSISKKLREFVRPFFDKNAYFCHKSALDSGRKLNFFGVFPFHLSKSCKKINTTCLPLRMTAFLKMHHFFRTPCRLFKYTHNVNFKHKTKSYT